MYITGFLIIIIIQSICIGVDCFRKLHRLRLRLGIGLGSWIGLALVLGLALGPPLSTVGLPRILMIRKRKLLTTVISGCAGQHG